MPSEEHVGTTFQPCTPTLSPQTRHPQYLKIPMSEIANTHADQTTICSYIVRRIVHNIARYVAHTQIMTVMLFITILLFCRWYISNAVRSAISATAMLFIYYSSLFLLFKFILTISCTQLLH